MTLEEMTAAVKEKVGDDAGVNATVKFLIDGEQVIHVDDNASPAEVTNEDKEAECTIKLKSSNFEKIINGDTNPMTAFMMGKIKVDGNMGVAMNINKIL